MTRWPTKKFDDGFVKNCLALVMQKFPKEWEQIEANELGTRQFTREEYRELWRPIMTFLFNDGYSDHSTIRNADLMVAIRFERIRQLGIELRGEDRV